MAGKASKLSLPCHSAAWMWLDAGGQGKVGSQGLIFIIGPRDTETFLLPGPRTQRSMSPLYLGRHGDGVLVPAPDGMQNWPRKEGSSLSLTLEFWVRKLKLELLHRALLIMEGATGLLSRSPLESN